MQDVQQRFQRLEHGEAELTSHMKEKKNTSVLLHVTTTSTFITSFFNPESAAVPTISSATKQTLIVVNKNEMLDAGVSWALKVANSHYSYKSCVDTSLVFPTMFPDSQIAWRFACGEIICAYLSTFGLAPYFIQVPHSQRVVQATDNCNAV